jgi:uncharacterized membrane protein YcaP (DUF421 family)
MVEGEVRILYRDGRMDRAALRKEGVSLDEFFGDLRMLHVEHLGQVKSAHMEVDGGLSVYFHTAEALRPGLPIGPDRPKAQHVPPHSPNGHVSCAHCGSTTPAALVPGRCVHCDESCWVAALDGARVE